MGGYAFGYVKPAVVAATPIASYASPVVSYNGVVNPLHNTYAGVHAIGKREAEADSQWIYNAGVYANGLYNTYGAGVHAIGKREAEGEADSQWVYNAGVYANGYNGYSIPKVFNGAYNTAIASPVVSYNGYTPLTGYTGYTGLAGYTTPYAYGNVWY